MTPEQFYTIASGIGLSRDFTFRVTQLGGVAGDGLALVKSASVPGRSIENMVAHVYGQQFNLGGAVRYTQSDGFPIELFCDANGSLRASMEALSIGTFNWGSGSSTSGNVIGLQLLNKTGNPGGVTYLLQGAQIRDISPINYTLDGTGEVVSFTASFAYQYYTGGK